MESGLQMSSLEHSGIIMRGAQLSAARTNKCRLLRKTTTLEQAGTRAFGPTEVASVVRFRQPAAVKDKRMTDQCKTRRWMMHQLAPTQFKEYVGGAGTSQSITSADKEVSHC